MKSSSSNVTTENTSSPNEHCRNMELRVHKMSRLKPRNQNQNWGRWNSAVFGIWLAPSPPLHPPAWWNVLQKVTVATLCHSVYSTLGLLSWLQNAMSSKGINSFPVSWTYNKYNIHYRRGGRVGIWGRCWSETIEYWWRESLLLEKQLILSVTDRRALSIDICDPKFCITQQKLPH